MNPLVLQLLAALEAGTIETFADISPEQFDALKEEFGLHPFTPEQLALLATLVLIATGKDAEIAAFNAASQLHKLAPAVLTDGEKVLPLDLLTWAGPGQGYDAAFPLLMSLLVRRVTGADWPTGGAE